MSKAGRKRKIIDLEKVESMAARGLTDKQIILCLGIGHDLFYKRKREMPEFSEALKKGKSKGLLEVTSAQFRSATSGNVTAQIFYLKNRDPENWRDRHEISGLGGGGPIKLVEFSVVGENAGKKK